MMRGRSKVVGALLALLASAALAQGQGPDGLAGDAEAAVETRVPVYDIELVVFAYPQGTSGRPEDFAYEDTGREAVQAERERVLGEPGRALGDIVADLVPDTRDILAATRRPLEFTPLPAEQWRLVETVQRLRNVGGFETMTHAAWRQPVYGPEEETTLDLERVADLPARLGGEASIYVTRFLHLKLDLALADISAPVGRTDTLVYRISERRKMRSTELHFFDHPRFGALALITPYEPDEMGEDGADAAAAAPPPGG